MTAEGLLSVFHVRRISRAAAVLLSTLSPGCASPEPVQIAEIEPAARVRFEAPSPDGEQATRVPRTGRFQGYDSAGVYISPEGRSLSDTIQWEDVQDLRVSTGRQIGAGIVLGMWGGLAAGWGALFLIQPDSYGWILLPLATVPAGGILGGIFAPEAWAPVETPR